MSRNRNILAVALATAASSAFAQLPPMDGAPNFPPHMAPPPRSGMMMPPHGGMGMPPHERINGASLMEILPPPELFMQNQQALGLTDAQKSSIRELMKKAVVQFTDLEWQESAEMEVLGQMLKQTVIDEPKAIAQLEKLLNIEREIKKIRLSTVIKLKNTLTKEQQEKLKSLIQPLPSPASAPGQKPVESLTNRPASQ